MDRYRYSVAAIVGRLLQDRHTSCIEELCALVLEDHRHNSWIADLKRGKRQLPTGVTGQHVIDASFAVFSAHHERFVEVCEQFERTDWTRSGQPTWDANRTALKEAVVAYAEQLAGLRAKYNAD